MIIDHKLPDGETRIAKVDDTQQLVFGWAVISMESEDGPLLVDLQQDMVEPAELERAAYEFVLNFRDAGERHIEGKVIGRLVESFVAVPEKLKAMGLPPDSLPIGWWVGFYIEDREVFEKVHKGLYKMFSIEGVAKRVAVA